MTVASEAFHLATDPSNPLVQKLIAADHARYTRLVKEFAIQAD